MPKTTKSIFKQLGVKSIPKIPNTWAVDMLVKGHALGEPRPLFLIIPAVKLEEW